MEIKKRYIVTVFVTLKIFEFSLGKKEDLKKMYDLFYTGEYIPLAEKSIRFIVETLEYIIALT